MKEKITAQDKVEANNLLEQAGEIMSECINCGICKSACPLFRVSKEERISGRGQAIMLREGKVSLAIFESTLDLGVEEVCPKGVKISQALLKAREAAVLLKEGLQENEDMIENLRKYGSPYGKKGEERTDKVYS